MTAVVLKKELTSDERWNAFVSQCGSAQPKVKQTELGFLSPAKLKVKGRYMNLGPLIRWGRSMLDVLDTPPPERPDGVNLDRLDEKFGWVRDYREAIDEWTQLHEIKTCALTSSRLEGYHATAAADLRETLAPLTGHASGQRVAAELVSVVRQQSAQLRAGESLAPAARFWKA